MDEVGVRGEQVRICRAAAEASDGWIHTAAYIARNENGLDPRTSPEDDIESKLIAGSNRVRRCPTSSPSARVRRLLQSLRSRRQEACPPDGRRRLPWSRSDRATCSIANGRSHRGRT